MVHNSYRLVHCVDFVIRDCPLQTAIAQIISKLTEGQKQPESGLGDPGGHVGYGAHT